MQFQHEPTAQRASSRTIRQLRPARLLVAMLVLAAGVVPRGAAAEEPRFTLNAYITQAYGWVVDGAPLLGLDEDGTADYHSGALLFRFVMSERDRVLIQLATESIGASALGDFRDDIELDWAFYERSFDSDTAIRVGRVPIPFGIYNEIRDVGTLLEFYRPPVSIYFEGAFSSETVDGVVLSHVFHLSDEWSLEADVYAGEWERAEYIAPTLAAGEAENAVGLQLWLQTPVQGLRFGLTAQRFDMVGGVEFLRSGDSDRFDIGLFSVDADFDRFFVRGEVQAIDTRFVGFDEVEVRGFYGMAGVRLNEAWELSMLYETSKTTSTGPFGAFEIDPIYEDWAASLVYRFSSAALVRFEMHSVGTNIADIATPFGQSELESDYAILSLSAAF